VLFAKYSQNCQVKEGQMDRECSTRGEKRNTCRLLVGKPDQKKQ
jgi:hypothetical protein